MPLYVKGRTPGRALAPACIALGVVVLFVSSSLWDNVVFKRIAFVHCSLFNDVTLVGFTLLVYGLLGAAPRALRALFTLGPLQLCGMMCYSLYLWHLLGISQWYERYWTVRDVPLYLIMLFIVSGITYRYVEFRNKPLRALFWDFPT